MGSVVHRTNGYWTAKWTRDDGKRIYKYAYTRERAFEILNEGLAADKPRSYQRALERQASGVKIVQPKLAPRDRFRTLERDDYRCVYCGRGSEDVALHVDHLIPYAKGGTDDLSNLVTACADCNWGKGQRLVKRPRLRGEGVAKGYESPETAPDSPSVSTK